jgi:predicted flavoprotein YhiN
MVKAIKGLEIELLSPRDIDEGISTNGGVSMSEITEELNLKKNSNIYIGGEMLDWDAPTGGYLIQACFTQAFIISKSISSRAKA